MITQRKRTRLSPEVRAKQIFDKMIELANELGFVNVTHTNVGEACGVSTGTVFGFLRTSEERDDTLCALVLESSCEGDITQHLYALLHLESRMKEGEFMLSEFLPKSIIDTYSDPSSPRIRHLLSSVAEWKSKLQIDVELGDVA